MKNLLAMCLLIPSLVLANPISCINGAELTDLTNEYKEIPYVRGVSSKGLSVVIFANSTTGSFTILERKAIDTYCAIVIGVGFEPVPKEIQDDIRQQQEKSKL
jgi:hypothetical protein